MYYFNTTSNFNYGTENAIKAKIEELINSLETLDRSKEDAAKPKAVPAAEQK